MNEPDTNEPEGRINCACPFCKGVVLSVIETAPRWYAVLCHGECGARGPARQSAQLAELAWNEGLEDAGSAGKFSQLCDEIEGEFPYYYAEVSRTRTTGWMAHLKTRHDDAGKRLAQGGGADLEGACASGLRDYKARQEKDARLRELAAIPEVAEALKLGLTAEQLKELRES